MASECILVQTIMFVLSVSQLGALSCQLSASKKTDYQFLGQPHEISEFWLSDTILSFSVYAKAESCGVFSWSGCSMPRERIMARGCHKFSYQLWYIWVRVQEPLNWSPNFSQREIVCVLLLNLCIHCWGKLWGFLFCHLADVQNQLFFE